MQNIAVRDLIENKKDFVLRPMATFFKDKNYTISFDIDGRAAFYIALMKGSIEKKILTNVQLSKGHYDFKVKSTLDNCTLVLKFYRPENIDIDDALWTAATNIFISEV